MSFGLLGIVRFYRNPKDNENPEHYENTSFVN